MSQRKPSGTNSNVQSQQKADALQHYQDTDGHFSLVRFVGFLPQDIWCLHLMNVHYAGISDWQTWSQS